MDDNRSTKIKRHILKYFNSKNSARSLLPEVMVPEFVSVLILQGEKQNHRRAVPAFEATTRWRDRDV
jgi:hypothetical protein